MTRLASVISFCTHDLRFLDKCIKGVQPLSNQIIIPICDHFYNGKAEDLELLQKIYRKYPEIDFIEFAYSSEEVYGTPARLIEGTPGWSQHWHNTARLVASYFVRPEIEYVLFLDVDEIFARNFSNHEYEAIRFATYWYFKDARSCASVTPDGPLLIKRECLSTELLLDPDERMGYFERVAGKKVREFCIDGKPIVHHYSWVRTKEEMLSKVRSWGHHWERDWETLMQQEGDFVRKYAYRETPLFWDPLEERVSLPEVGGAAPNVVKVNAKMIFRMEIEEKIRS